MDIYNPTKTCSKCGIDKPHSEYYKCSRLKSGHYPHCKECHSIHNKENYQKNKNRHSDYNKEYYQNNKDKLIIKTIERQKIRRNTDSIYKFKCNIKTIIRNSITKQGYTKRSRTHEILGCDYDTIIQHIESQFDDNMSWDNHGTYWDIDHIIPTSSAKTEEDIIRLNHYTNLQPLESNYNRYVKKANII